MNVTCTPFTPNADKKPPLLIEDGRAFVASKYIQGYAFGQDTLLQSGVYRYLGWMYDLKPYLKKYLVRDAFSSRNWTAYYAPNKTMLREVLRTKEKIMELKE